MRRFMTSLLSLLLLISIASAQNYCLEFDENCSDYVTVPHSADFYFDNEFTVEAWFTVHGSHVNDWARIISTYPATHESGTGWSIVLHEPFGELYPTSIFGTYFNEFGLEAAFTPVLDQWNHAAFSFDGATARLFIDGEMITQNLGYNSNPTNSEPLTIGGQNGNWWNRNLNGRIDEVRISDVCRYTSNFTPSTFFDPDPNTVALWHFDESVGDVVYDASGNGHDGTISGAAWIEDGPQLPPDVNIELTYLSGSPVPPEGGNLYYDLYVENADPNALDFDAWLATEYEGGSPTTLVMRAFFNYQPGWTINRPGMFYPVPGSWAAGNYMFYGRVGVCPTEVWDESGFPFEKLGVSDGVGFIPYPVEGAPNPFDNIIKSDGIVIHPETHALLSAYPNPFNPTTTLSFNLDAAGQVKLSIYDIQGRLLTTLVDGFRNTGIHEVTFGADNLSSGIYFAQIETGDRNVMQKLMLVK
ncbi:T9SS type A sorting domain-containing protein [bacterium]|nr:T9SS type A sorting domain-containing protein [bacterium]MBU1650824.1 T9SS type A sorting domain-containing protein [bacterium]